MRIAVVTGASSGLGREFVLALDRLGGFDEIWAIARRNNRLAALQNETATHVRPILLDLTHEEDIASYSAMLRAETPEVYVLVNAAGYAKFGTWQTIPPDENRGMLLLNCAALVEMTEATLPFMPHGGRVLQIASIAAFQPLPHLNTYAATKSFVLSYSRALNREVRPLGITVTAICPGWMKTEFFSRAEQTGHDITYYDCFHKPADVVTKALADSAHGRDISIHGIRTKIESMLIKLLPHSLVIDIWQRQQKFID